MMHKAWSSIEEGPYCFWRSYVKFQGHTGWKIDDLNPIWVRLLGRLQLLDPSDLPCFKVIRPISRSHRTKKSYFDPNWGFPDCNSSLNLPWLRNDAQSLKYVRRYSFSRSSVTFQGHTAKKRRFNPNWAFPDCDSSLNSQMDWGWCTKHEVA